MMLSMFPSQIMMAERVVLALKVKIVILKTVAHQLLLHMAHGVLVQHHVVVELKVAL